MLTVTATDLPRLMGCNGSRLMGGFVPPIESDDTVRNEGIAADWLVSMVHSGKVASADELVDRKAPNGVFITGEMVEYLDEYLKATVGGLVEYNTDFGRAEWQVNGRADLIKYDPVTYHLTVGDLKYGWGIVEPDLNWTLIAHAIGFTLNSGKRVDAVTLTVFQPRADHRSGRVRPWSFDATRLRELVNELTETLCNPTNELRTGEHCYKCPALATCPAARKAQLNAIDASERAFVDTVDNPELSFRLDHIKRGMEILTQLQKAYSELALHRIREGQIVPNYSLDNELTNRQWKDNVTPEIALMMTGKDLTKKQLMTPSQAEKAGASKEFVAAFTERRNKGVKLVRVDAHAKATKLFERK